jgi:hypothetical protein
MRPPLRRFPLAMQSMTAIAAGSDTSAATLASLSLRPTSGTCYSAPKICSFAAMVALPAEAKG